MQAPLPPTPASATYSVSPSKVRPRGLRNPEMTTSGSIDCADTGASGASAITSTRAASNRHCLRFEPSFSGLLHDPWVESRCCDSSGERRAEAAVGEHGQSDERFDAAETEGSSHDQAQLL